ncbi:MAG: hypothetical protein ACXVBE_06835 [Bdellovibrionota bacterium]
MNSLFSALLLSIALSLPAYAGSIGGTTGGGGNIPPAEQIDAFNMINFTFRANLVVRAYLSSKYFEYKETKCPNDSSDYARIVCSTGAKMFDGKTTIFDVLEKAPVELKFKEACTDAEGKPMDGSIYGKKPGSICLSLHTIHEKVSKTDYAEQISSLLLHETSHLVGTTEEEARALQDDMLLGALKRTPADATWNNAYLAREWTTDDLVERVNTWGKKVDADAKLSGSCKLASDIADQLFEFHEKWIDNGYSFTFYTPENEQNFLGGYLRARALADYLCSVDPRNTARERKDAKALYLSNFGENESIPANAYADRKLYRYINRVPGGIKLKKINSSAALLEEKKALLSSYNAIGKWAKEKGIATYAPYSGDCEIMGDPDAVNAQCTFK